MTDVAPQNSQHEKVEAERCDYFNRFLAMKEGSAEHKFGCQIASFTVLLCDDYSVDLNLVNGEADDAPYLDVHFRDGDQEVETFIRCDKLEGTYKFYDSYEKRELVLILERA